MKVAISVIVKSGDDGDDDVVISDSVCICGPGIVLQGGDYRELAHTLVSKVITKALIGSVPEGIMEDIKKFVGGLDEALRGAMEKAEGENGGPPSPPEGPDILNPN